MSLLQEYTEFTRTTAIYPANIAEEYLTLGLVSEAGEVAGKLKKFIRDSTPYSVLQEELAKELGDVMWYVVRLCDEMDIDIELTIHENMKKLQDRKDRNVLGGSGDTR